MTYEELLDALDGLHAYDVGATDSGIHDERLRQRCIDYINGLPDDEQRVILSRIVRDIYLTDDAIKAGYGWEDALDFLQWVDDGFRA